MKGKAAAFFIACRVLFSHGFILDSVVSCGFCRKPGVEVLYDLTYGCVDFLIGEDFLGGIHQEDVKIAFKGKLMLLFSPAFADSSLQEISLDRPFEEFL